MKNKLLSAKEITIKQNADNELQHGNNIKISRSFLLFQVFSVRRVIRHFLVHICLILTTH